MLGERLGDKDGLRDGDAECRVTIAVINPFVTVIVQSSVVKEPVTPIVVAFSPDASSAKSTEAVSWNFTLSVPPVNCRAKPTAKRVSGSPNSMPFFVMRHPDTPGTQLVERRSAASCLDLMRREPKASLMGVCLSNASNACSGSLYCLWAGILFGFLFI